MMSILSNGNLNKSKVVFIMGATGTGKSRLSIDIATRIPSEIINSDKIQVHKGLDITTNKVSKSEMQGVVHHLLGSIETDSNFTVADFCTQAVKAIEKILKLGKVPIIVGGSNSYVEALVEEHFVKFKSLYDCCFIQLDISQSVLYSFVGKRVDQMIDAGITELSIGLVKEVGEIFDHNADYSKGIRRAIGVPELHKYFLEEKKLDDENKKVVQDILASAIKEMKENTCKLVDRQLVKIDRLRNELKWKIHRIDATYVFQIRVKEAAGIDCRKKVDAAWMELVVKQSMDILTDFLK